MSCVEPEVLPSQTSHIRLQGTGSQDSRKCSAMMFLRQVSTFRQYETILKSTNQQDVEKSIKSKCLNRTYKKNMSYFMKIRVITHIIGLKFK